MNAHFASLPGEALLYIAGPDTLTFLQGQTTCDTRQVNAAQAVPGAYCTPQGRMVCDFLLAQLGDTAFGLRMRRDLLDAAATTFGKYIVFSRAELAPDRDDWQVYGCWGTDAAAALAQALGEVPAQAYGVAAGNGTRVLQLDDAGEFFELWINREQGDACEAALAAHLQESDEQDWRATQIRAARGRLEGPTSGLFLPQDLNYDRIGLVNFRKGCYTGQEIVARLHYRGTPKRRSYPARLEAAPPTAGEALFTAESSQSIGNVVNAASDGEGCLVLACVASSAVDQTLHVGSQDGPALTLMAPPYPLADAAD